MSLGRIAPNTRETAAETQERVWRQHGYVAVSIDDPEMPWDLREMLKRFMTRRHGVRNIQGKRT
jgi:hypothetical protein